MSDWQPIETAPRNGSWLLLWWQACAPLPGVAVGKYEYADTEKPPGAAEGWRCEGDQCIPINQQDCTHWMPLPAPPE